MLATIKRSWRPDMRCTSKHDSATPGAGPATRADWSHIGVVSLNPERDSVANTTAASALHTRQMAA
jgi:hypothetical protein